MVDDYDYVEPEIDRRDRYEKKRDDIVGNRALEIAKENGRFFPKRLVTVGEAIGILNRVADFAGL